MRRSGVRLLHPAPDPILLRLEVHANPRTSGTGCRRSLVVVAGARNRTGFSGYAARGATAHHCDEQAARSRTLGAQETGEAAKGRRGRTRPLAAEARRGQGQSRAGPQVAGAGAQLDGGCTARLRSSLGRDRKALPRTSAFFETVTPHTKKETGSKGGYAARKVPQQ